MDIAAFIVSIFAVAFAGGAMWYARGQKLAADRAADAAEAAERRAANAEERGRVAWELEHVRKSMYLLRNNGTDTAYDVHVDRGDMAVHGGGEEHFAEFPAEHAEKYVLARTFGRVTNALTVTWHQDPEHGDERRQQQLPIA